MFFVGSCSHVGKVTESPGDASSVAVAGKGVRDIGTGGCGQKCSDRGDIKVNAVRGILDGIAFITVTNDQGRDPFFEGKQGGLVARIEQGIQWVLGKGPRGSVAMAKPFPTR